MIWTDGKPEPVYHTSVLMLLGLSGGGAPTQRGDGEFCCGLSGGGNLKRKEFDYLILFQK